MNNSESSTPTYVESLIREVNRPGVLEIFKINLMSLHSNKVIVSMGDVYVQGEIFPGRAFVYDAITNQPVLDSNLMMRPSETDSQERRNQLESLNNIARTLGRAGITNMSVEIRMDNENNVGVSLSNEHV